MDKRACPDISPTRHRCAPHSSSPSFRATSRRREGATTILNDPPFAPLRRKSPVDASLRSRRNLAPNEINVLRSMPDVTKGPHSKRILTAHHRGAPSLKVQTNGHIWRVPPDNGSVSSAGPFAVSRRKLRNGSRGRVIATAAKNYGLRKYRMAYLAHQIGGTKRRRHRDRTSSSSLEKMTGAFVASVGRRIIKPRRERSPSDYRDTPLHYWGNYRNQSEIDILSTAPKHREDFPPRRH